MEQGKISVIVPVYNGAAWIEECVRSVQAQTWKNWEMLILDDSSCDGTGRIAQGMADRDRRIRVVNRIKRGVSSARNQGIDETDGEFLTFLDADDKLEPRMLEVLYGCLTEEKSDIAVCDYYRWNGKQDGIFDRSGKRIGAQENGIAEKAGTSAAHLKRFTLNRDAYIGEYLLRGNTRCWSILYRREAVGDTRFREELTIGEDMMFLTDLLPALSRITLTGYRGYFYRINENGVMLRPFTPSYMDEIRSWKLACEKIGAGWPAQRARVNSILAVSAMLAAGKLSRLSAKERKTYKEQIAECRETVKEALLVPGAKDGLPEGYRAKTALYTLCPPLYLWLYHIWKKEKKR